MAKQIYNLTKLQLKKLYGINEWRYCKDKNEKRKKTFLAIAYLVVAIMMAFYIGAMAWGYTVMGLAEILPAYLIMLSSLIILAFSVFKAGSIIFQKNAYDMLISLPVTQIAIVVSRFLYMYIENILLVFIVMIPAMIVYGVMMQPGILFYLIGTIVTLFIPLIPITIATVIGGGITAIASRMKHKNLANTVLSVLLVVVIMAMSSKMSTMEEAVSLEELQKVLEIMLVLIGRIYPPAVWLGNAMLTGDFMLCCLCVAGGLAVFVFVIAVVAMNFEWICRGLYSTNAKHDYQMGDLKHNTVLAALYKRELKRYFSSSVYVTNTIIGPVMAVLFSVGMLVAGEEQMQVFLELPFDLRGMIPFALASIFGIMPITCTSISMEGKEWWIIKSLPVKTKDILDSKLLLNLSVAFPFWVVSEVLMVIAIKPNVMELFWLFVIPVVMILFSTVFGITVNLKMPVFTWENEVTIVKQSGSAFFGGIGGFLIILLCAIPVLIAPVKYVNLVKLLICLLVIGVTWFLYKSNNKVNL